jgi:hypothetical protein
MPMHLFDGPCGARGCGTSASRRRVHHQRFRRRKALMQFPVPGIKNLRLLQQGIIPPLCTVPTRHGVVFLQPYCAVRDWIARTVQARPPPGATTQHSIRPLRLAERTPADARTRRRQRPLRRRVHTGAAATPRDPLHVGRLGLPPLFRAASSGPHPRHWEPVEPVSPTLAAGRATHPRSAMVQLRPRPPPAQTNCPAGTDPSRSSAPPSAGSCSGAGSTRDSCTTRSGANRSSCPCGR